MKILLAQLAAHLKQTLAPLYVICSDEILLAEEAVNLIQQQVKYEERLFISVDPGHDWGQTFFANVYEQSLFSEKRLLIFSIANKFTQANGKFLQDYAENPTQDTTVILRLPMLEKKIEQTTWFKALEKNSVILTIWPIKKEELSGWIMQRAKKVGFTMTINAANLLAEQVEGNLLAAAQEIEKIFLLLDNHNKNTPVGEQLIMQLNTDNARFDLFDLVESALSGNHKRSLTILSHLAAEATEPTLILWAITRELRMLIAMIEQTQRGIPLATLFKQFRIWENRASSIRTFLNKHSLTNTHHMLQHAAKIDRIIKGIAVGDVWQEFTDLIVYMGGKQCA